MKFNPSVCLMVLPANARTDLTDTNIMTAADLWVSSELVAIFRYGPVEFWDTSKVTIMDGLWCGNRDVCEGETSLKQRFNDDIGLWDVASVTSMKNMFNGAESFSQDRVVYGGGISSWDVASVRSMKNMFNGAKSFSRDLSSWDVSLVNDMSSSK
jgi:surface protein